MKKHKDEKIFSEIIDLVCKKFDVDFVISKSITDEGKYTWDFVSRHKKYRSPLAVSRNGYIFPQSVIKRLDVERISKDAVLRLYGSEIVDLTDWEVIVQFPRFRNEYEFIIWLKML